jgi:hypothetical protein
MGEDCNFCRSRRSVRHSRNTYNLRCVQSAKRLLDETEYSDPSSQKKAFDTVKIICQTIRKNRFDLYFENEKETAYELVASDKLIAFYRALGEKFQAELADDGTAGVHFWLGLAVTRGEGYIAEAKVPYTPKPHPFEWAHNLVKEESLRPGVPTSAPPPPSTE